MKNRGGGLAVVVIVLAIICVVFLAAGFMVLSTWGGLEWWNKIPTSVKNVQEYSVSQIQEAEVNDYSKFEISSVSSNLDIVYSDTDTVKVELKGSYRSGRGEIKLKKESVGSTVKIYVDYPRMSGWFSWNDTKLTITMPKEMEGKTIEFNSVSGNLDIPDGLIADVIRVNCTSGNVQSYNITCNEFHYNNVSGNIKIDGDIKNRIELETVSGKTDIRLDEITKRVKVSSISGDVDIYLENSIDFKYEFSTVSGSFKCDFPLYSQGTNNNKSGYTDENAEMTMEISTISGDLDISN